MASSAEFARYVAEQFAYAGIVEYRKLFGEYGLYLNGVYFACAAANQLFVKPTKAGRAFAPDLPEAPPYEGAKPCLLVGNVDDRAFLARLAELTCAELPPPRLREKNKYPPA